MELKDMDYQRVLEVFKDNSDALASWAASTVVDLGCRQEWEMELNFGVVESLVLLASKFDLPSAGDQDAEGLAFWRRIGVEIGAWEAEDEDEEEPEVPPSIDWFAPADPQGLHIHTAWSSRDCDGRYERTGVIIPGDYGDTTKKTVTRSFWKEVIGDHLPWNGSITVEDHDTYVTAEIAEPTEEGASNWVLTLCKSNDADTPPTYRDHSAEKAGY